MELNANIPPVRVLVRKEYLFNLEERHGEFEHGWIFACCAIRSRALMFHVLLENGAVFYRLPISAFCTNKKAKAISLEILSTWDCLSDKISVIEFDFLKGMEVSCILKDKSKLLGRYLFTVDFWGSQTLAEDPSEHKCAHVIELEDGNFCLLPNNRLLFRDSSLVPRQDEIPPFKANTHRWTSENGSKWVVKDEGLMRYEIEERSTDSHSKRKAKTNKTK